MILPNSVDHSIISGSSLKLKAKTVEKSDGRLVGGKHVGFYPVEATFCCCDRDGGADGLRRIALMLEERV